MKRVPLVLLCKTAARVAAPALGKMPDMGGREGPSFGDRYRGSGLSENLFTLNCQRSESKISFCPPDLRRV